LWNEDGSLTSPLYGIDSTRIGVVSFTSPTLASSQERIGNTFREISGALQFVLVALLAFLVWGRIDRIQQVLWRSLAITVLVWLVRQVLLWVDIPSLFSSSGVFDPVYFASKFGNGMAKSIGELTLSSLALLVNVIIVARYILDEKGIDTWWHPGLPGFGGPLLSHAWLFSSSCSAGMERPFECGLRLSSPVQ
jgi:hypothetical protein